MIFKQLFSPKHTHSDPIKRKSAVEAMKGDTAEQQAILKLLFNLWQNQKERNLLIN